MISLQENIEYLKFYNAWRGGAYTPSPIPSETTAHLNFAIKALTDMQSIINDAERSEAQGE